MAGITIYTDGASGNKTGLDGGAAAIIIAPNGKKFKVVRGYTNTSNNRMELRAVINALDALVATHLPVTLYSDSEYVVKAFTEGWVYQWERNAFNGRKNVDLWKALLVLVRRQKSIKFIWVKGHANNHYNNLCDRLAVQAKQTANKIPCLID